MKFTKDNSGFICHRCFYISFYKCDMIRHCDKRFVCKNISNCLLNNKTLSTNNRYYLNNEKLNINFLTSSELLYLTINFNNNSINIIDDINNNDLFKNT